MTTIGRPFCWPCRHYRRSKVSHGPISGIHPLDHTCAAFPEGIPGLILAGGFDHRDPYAGDNGVRFEIRTDEEFDWDEKRTNDFLDRELLRFKQRELRAKALATRRRPDGSYGGALTDTPPTEAALDRFTAPMPIVTGEAAIRHAAAWEEYRLTGDPEIMYEAGVWARPDE